jgi:hypothetical protein
MTAQALWITTKGELVELEALGLTALQEAVGGWVQAIELTPNLCLWVNEEGKMHKLPHNLKGQAIWDSFFGEDTDYIVGNVVLTGGTDRDGDTLPLSAEVMTTLTTVLA